VTATRTTSDAAISVRWETCEYASHDIFPPQIPLLSLPPSIGSHTERRDRRICNVTATVLHCSLNFAGQGGISGQDHLGRKEHPRLSRRKKARPNAASGQDLLATMLDLDVLPVGIYDSAHTPLPSPPLPSTLGEDRGAMYYSICEVALA
jgi:hypothetical protein